MHTFRFNPLEERWVLVGDLGLSLTEIKPGSVLDVGKTAHFLAASHPHSPFILDTVSRPEPASRHLLFTEQLPLGEYELLLYQGNNTFFNWRAAEWEGWLDLLQHRLRQLAANPRLHWVRLFLPTALLHSLREYQRVGELLAASQPVFSPAVSLRGETVQKLLEKERAFVLQQEAEGFLLAASAPLKEMEVYYLPLTEQVGIEQEGRAAKQSLARCLSRFFNRMRQEFGEKEYCLELYTSLTTHPDPGIWWLKIYTETESGQTLARQDYPERWVKRLLG